MRFPTMNERFGAAVRCALAVLFCVAGVSLWSCSQSTGPLVIINVDLSEVPEVTKLIVNPSLDGRPLEQKEYTEDFATFGLRLPGGSEGEFRVSIEGQRADKTKIALRDSETITVSGQNTFPLSVKLSRAPRGPIKVTRDGGLLGNHLYAVWGTSMGDVWVGGEQTLHYRSGPNMPWVARPVDPVSPGDTVKFTIRGLWGTTPTNMWAVGEFKNQISGDMGGVVKTYQAAYSVGGNWQLIPAMTSDPIALKAVRGTSSTRVFASGSRYVGGYFVPFFFTLSKEWVATQAYRTCDRKDSLNSINALWVDQTRVWGAGFFSDYYGSGALLYTSESSPPFLERPGMHTSELSGIWSSGDGSGWMVSNTGAILRRSLNANLDMGADSWQLVSPSPASAPLSAVWGFSNNDIWVVGAKGTMLHYGESGTWENVTVEGQVPIEDLWAVWGRSPNDVWIVGNGGTVYHYSSP